MNEIYLRKKYYDGEQIHRIVTEELDDYETIMRILGRFADEPSAEPKQTEWIPCSERLPETAVSVLVTGRAKVGDWCGVDISRFSNGRWLIDGYEVTNWEIIAWMPLPEPYKGDRHETD